MKKNVLPSALLVVAGFLFSCLSPPTTNKPYRPIQEVPNAIVVGTIDTNFFSEYLAGYSQDNRLISEAAYTELYKTAQEKYGGTIDIVDITWAQVRLSSPSGSIFRPDEYEYSARGKVIVVNQNSGIENALARASKDAVKNIAKNNVMAIVYITANDQAASTYIADELEYILLKEGYILCDRSQLDILRKEQNLQISGEVDDSSAVGIGKFMGATIIVTGKLDGDNNLRRLRLRMLDVQTGRIVGGASEQF